MILISHRGNLNGAIPHLENNPYYILKALHAGFEVEIDVWYKNGWWTGHDAPKFNISNHLSLLRCCWCHLKNPTALEMIGEIPNAHYFWHEEDAFTLTSMGYIWSHVKSPFLKGSICVLPEKYLMFPEQGTYNNHAGICSDMIARFK